MTKIDIILATSLVLLILVVTARIWLGKRKASSSVNTHVKEITGEDNQSNSPQKPISHVKKNESTRQEKQTIENNISPEIKPSKTSSFNEIKDPVLLIKTFSAPTEKRIEAIRIAGIDQITDAVPALIEALYEPDENISSAAAESLGKIGDPRAIEPLLEMSKRTDAQLINEFSRKEDGSEDSEQEIEDKPYNFKELTVFKIDQLPKEYFQKDGSPIPRNELVVKGLKDSNQQLRQMAAKAAIGMNEEELIEPLVEVLSNKFEVESVRYMAAEALGEIGSENTVEPLLIALKDKNVAVRYSAAAALSGKTDSRIVNALIESMSDEDSYVRSSVAFALGTTGDENALNALFKSISDPSDVVRFSIAKGIACFDAELVFKQVDSYLEINDKYTNLGLIDLLGQLKTPTSIKYLRKFLKSENSEISYKASIVLMEQEDLEFIDEIIEVSKRMDRELMNLFDSEIEINNDQDSTINDNDNDSLTNSIDNSPILENIRQKLIDSNATIRGRAASDLGGYESDAAINLLISILNDNDEYVRSSAITSLGNIGQEKCLHAIIKMRNDPSDEVRYSLVRALANFYDEKAVECLEEIIENDAASDVKRNARIVIEKLKA